MNKLTNTIAAKKPVAVKASKVAAPKEGGKKIDKVLEDKPAEVKKEVKSFQTMLANTESTRRQVGHPEKEPVKVGKPNNARPGTARHTAIQTAQSCKNAGELYGKLATNWVNWLKNEGYVTIGA